MTNENDETILMPGRTRPSPVPRDEDVISHDAVYPREEAERYRLYALQKDGTITVRATSPDPEGLGLALITIARERLAAGESPEIIGVLDAVEHKWLTTLWRGRS